MKTPDELRAGILDYRLAQLERLRNSAAWDDLQSDVRCDVEDVIGALEGLDTDDAKDIARVMAEVANVEALLRDRGVELPDVD